MRKYLFIRLFLFMVFLVGCSSMPADNLPPVALFDVSESCPNVCWLGIQPGVTTAEEAYEVLLNSRYIDRKTVDWYKSPNEWYPDGISARWLTEPDLRLFADVGLGIENNRVQTMWFKDLKPITLQELITVFGEPAEISVYLDRNAPGGTSITYTLFYYDPKIIMHILWWDTGLSGPGPNDTVHEIILNQPILKDPTSPTSNAQRRYEDAQPWLGYGQLEEYLPDEEIP
jgi:hypothetical protein